MSKRVQISTYVSEEVAAEAETIAETQDRSLASLLRLALLDLLAREKNAQEAGA